MAAVLGLAAALSPLAVSAADPPLDLLVGYSFEEHDLATGPDTFRVFEHSKGTVNLSRHFRLSGYRAVEIRDVPGDGDFPELQGYFDERHDGWLFAHFAVLLTDPAEELNIALAGPRGFRLAKDGIAFWLTTREGFFVHYSDSIPKRLLRPQPFTWYHVDLALDLVAGRYDLRLQEEGAAEAIVDLYDQPSAASQPGSVVNKFSFIGDRGQDTSSVIYYVDDVAIGIDEVVRLRPFVAPGRRRLFIDILDEAKQGGGRLRCLPAIDLADFGADRGLLAGLRNAELALVAQALWSLPRSLPEGTTFPELERLVAGATAWRSGCAALARGRDKEALRLLGEATERVPESPLYESAYVLALAQAGRWGQVDEWLSWLEGEWQADPRLLVLEAQVGRARPDLAEAEEWVEASAWQVLHESPSPLLARLWSGERNRELTAALQAQLPDDWRLHLRQALIPTQYYSVLLWRARFDEARDYALRIAAALEESGLDSHLWRERAGDASFHAGRPSEALGLYEKLLDEQQGPPHLLLKLSDVFYALGDLEGERAYREAIYGRLAEE